MSKGEPTEVILARVQEIQPGHNSGMVLRKPKATELTKVPVTPSVSGGVMSEEEKNKARAEAVGKVFGK